MPAQFNMSAQQQAYIHIQDQIVSGELLSGTRLKPEVIAEFLGLSRMPVREAIRQLDAEGYVTIRPNRGAIVRTRSPDDVLELFEMRAVLEGLAVGRGAHRITPEMLEDLEMENQALRRLGRNRLEWIDRHNQFHDALCAIGSRGQLQAECRRLRLALSPYLRLFMKLHSNPELPGYEHEHILEALRTRDSEAAEKVMRAHVMANATEIAHCLAAAPAQAQTEAAE